jgi:hypothetical protein
MLDAFFGIFIMLLEDKGEEAAAAASTSILVVARQCLLANWLNARREERLEYVHEEECSSEIVVFVSSGTFEVDEWVLGGLCHFAVNLGSQK